MTTRSKEKAGTGRERSNELAFVNQCSGLSVRWVDLAERTGAPGIGSVPSQRLEVSLHTDEQLVPVDGAFRPSSRPKGATFITALKDTRLNVLNGRGTKRKSCTRVPWTIYALFERQRLGVQIRINPIAMELDCPLTHRAELSAMASRYQRSAISQKASA